MVGDEGCTLADLAVRLGLSPRLARTVADAVRSLVDSGWLELVEDRVTPTEAGREYLGESLAEWV